MVHCVPPGLSVFRFAITNSFLCMAFECESLAAIRFFTCIVIVHFKSEVSGTKKSLLVHVISRHVPDMQ
jgi:hypothetical protein